MKRYLKQKISFVLVFLLLISPAALADLERGDRGVEVEELQQLLFETGWLFELPDGIYGKRTEAAVKGFEKYANLPVDGIADDQMIYELSVSLEVLNEELGIVSDYFGKHVAGYFTGTPDYVFTENYTGDGMASDNNDSREAIVLNSSVIIEGNTIYYAGAPEGEGNGVYAMNYDGGNLRKISDVRASLKAVSNGNVLLANYDNDGHAVLEILRSDGTLENLGFGNSYAIAKDGRFYFGGSSIAEDGTDHQWLLSSDPEYHDNYYPVDVVDGYLYYLDANGGTIAYYEGGLPGGDLELNRLNLGTGEIELISGAGTYYLGIEDGMLYYTREDFNVFDDESGGTFRIEVDEGLYSMNLEAMAETMIAELSDDLLVFEYYMFVEDGVIYGEYSDYNPDDAVYRIMRRQVNGYELPALDMGNKDITILCVEDGRFYGLEGNYTEYDDGSYSYEEYLVIYDLHSGALLRFAFDENETMFYTEVRPRIAVVDDHVYYYVMNETNGAESLKSMSLTGEDLGLLVKGEPLY